VPTASCEPPYPLTARERTNSQISQVQLLKRICSPHQLKIHPLPPNFVILRCVPLKDKSPLDNSKLIQRANKNSHQRKSAHLLSKHFIALQRKERSDSSLSRKPKKKTPPSIPFCNNINLLKPHLHISTCPTFLQTKV
jgi:hypothetical protein